MRLRDIVSHEVICVAPNDGLDKAICLMEEFDIHHLPVVESQRVVGMVSDRDLLLSVGWRLSTERQVRSAGKSVVVGPERVGQVMSRPAITLSGDESLRVAADTMLNHKIHALPIVHDGRLIGIVTETDLLRKTLRLPKDSPAIQRLLRPHVAACMTAAVITVGPQTPVTEVARVFHDRHIRHAPVVAAGILLGIISDRDVRKALGVAAIEDARAEEQGQFYLGPQAARDIMTRKLVTLTPNASIADAIQKMVDRGIHCLPVVEDDRLQGIVTETDVIRSIAEEDVL